MRSHGVAAELNREALDVWVRQSWVSPAVLLICICGSYLTFPSLNVPITKVGRMTVPPSQDCRVVHVKLVERDLAHKSSIIVHHYDYDDFLVTLKISKRMPALLASLISFSLRRHSRSYFNKGRAEIAVAQWQQQRKRKKRRRRSTGQNGRSWAPLPLPLAWQGPKDSGYMGPIIQVSPFWAGHFFYIRTFLKLRCIFSYYVCWIPKHFFLLRKILFGYYLLELVTSLESRQFQKGRWLVSPTLCTKYQSGVEQPRGQLAIVI